MADKIIIIEEFIDFIKHQPFSEIFNTVIEKSI